MIEPDKATENYDFELPEESIAKFPADPRDTAKLLVYNRTTNSVAHAIFKDILDFLPPKLSIIVNDTKVYKARIYGIKRSGGAIEMLLVKELTDGNFLAFVRGKVSIGTEILIDKNVVATVKSLNSDGSRIVRFYRDQFKIMSSDDIFKLLEDRGEIPLPPYIDREVTKEDEINYQSVFAKNIGSVAAPTASLHFTDELWSNIKKKYKTSTLTLHVGAGTFKPVDVEDITQHHIHSEYFSVPRETREIIEGNDDILAVGSTVTRVIEYAYRTKIDTGECNLFLNPLNRPFRVNYLLTNFHLPKSTLIMLVASFIGRENTLKLYNEAIANNYKFYSYGDAMLII
jgi:S-adenosylmethionine:tRNA ribosyltransferase-isomerase